MLRDGPRTARDIWAKAKPLGHSQRTLTRARDALGIRTRRVHKDGRTTSYWLLPGQQLPPGVASADDDAVDEWLRQLNEQYPPSAPLEEL